MKDKAKEIIKKVFIFLLAVAMLMLLLFGIAGFFPKKERQKEPKKETETQKESSKEEQSSESLMEEQLLYEDEKVCIRAVSLEYAKSGALCLWVCYENKSQEECAFGENPGLCINGKEVRSLEADWPVRAGKKLVMPVLVPDNKLEDAQIDEIHNIDISFRISEAVNDEIMEEGYDTDVIHISLEKNPKR